MQKYSLHCSLDAKSVILGSIILQPVLIILKGKFSSGTEFLIIFKPLVDGMIFKSKYNFVILELIGQPCCDLERNNSKNV